MPVTIQFGPWAPDQDDTPIQIPDTQEPLPVPCADVLNVIYTNGNYRSIESPVIATINGNLIQPISATPVNAFSYFDQVAQQETVFAGTGTGVQQLNPDGSWSQVTLITTQITALIGQAMNFIVGNFLNSNTARSSVMRFTVGALTPVISGQSFVAGRVVLWLPLNTSVTYTGYSNVAPTFGSVSSSNPFAFGTLQTIKDMLGTLSGSTNGSTFSVGTTSDPGKSAFTTITVNGVTMSSASAVYSYSATNQIASWTWSALFGLATGNTYSVSVT